MQVAYAILCRYASFGRDGLPTIAGGEIDVLMVNHPDATQLPLYLVVKCMFTSVECGREWTIAHELLDSRGNRLWGVEQRVVPPDPPRPGRPMKFMGCVEFSGVSILEPGVYSLRISADGETKHEQPIYAERMPEQELAN